MGAMFDVKELVKVGIADEVTGAAFYAAAAKKTKDAALAKTFAEVAEQERGHEKRFKAMLAAMGDYKSPEGYSGEYAAYLESLTKDRAFGGEDDARRMVEGARDDDVILEVAIGMERDTLILMQEMKTMVAERDRDTVEDLINEERGHVVVLTAAREKLKK